MNFKRGEGGAEGKLGELFGGGRCHLLTIQDSSAPDTLKWIRRIDPVGAPGRDFFKAVIQAFALVGAINARIGPAGEDRNSHGVDDALGCAVWAARGAATGKTVAKEPNRPPGTEAMLPK